MTKPYKVIIKNSTRDKKKKMAIFYGKDKKVNGKTIKGKKIKTTHFGQRGASDYTKHKDDERKKRYINRHKTRENWNKPMTAGALSRWILWNKKTLSSSTSMYKKKFKLK
jgi:hypothetical protein